MGIYIPSVKLPPDEKYKWELVLHISYDGTVRSPWGQLVTEGKAIELPEHGRLIDADALLEYRGLGTDCSECKRDERSCQFEMIHTTMDFCGWIEDAPTIIPADGGES